VDADVDAGEGDRGSEEVERDREPRNRGREDRGAGEARRRVARRERVVSGDAHEGLGTRIPNGRAVDVEHALQGERERVGEAVRRGDDEQDRGSSLQQRHRERDPDPDEPEGADLREPDEDVVEDAGPVVDDKALEVPVETEDC
jgi:hypothetical protein